MRHDPRRHQRARVGAESSPPRAGRSRATRAAQRPSREKGVVAGGSEIVGAHAERVEVLARTRRAPTARSKPTSAGCWELERLAESIAYGGARTV